MPRGRQVILILQRYQLAHCSLRRKATVLGQRLSNKLIMGIALAMSLGGLPASKATAHDSNGRSSADAQFMYHVAWQQVRDNFVDPRFAGQDWSAWEHKFDGQLHDIPDAVKAVQTMTASLSDPYTRVSMPTAAHAREDEQSEHCATHGCDAHPVTSMMRPDGIGYVKISTFTSRHCVEDFQHAIESLSQAKALILDLRGNGGGFVTSAMEIADMLLQEGDIMTAISRQEKHKYTASGAPLTRVPLTVLVDHQSASATEILVGALHDNHRATIIGTTTFGKGVIQNVIQLPGGALLYVTSARYVTPSGSDINKVGISPDINIPDAAEEMKAAVQNATACCHSDAS